MGSIAAATLLDRAKKAGFTVNSVSGKLSINGPKDKPEIVEALISHKTEILAEIQSQSRKGARGPEKLDTNPQAARQLFDRMSSGMEWLVIVWKQLEHPSDPKVQRKRERAFSRNLHQWALLDELKRILFPNHSGCSLGGEDGTSGRCQDDQPIRCYHCAGAA